MKYPKSVRGTFSPIYRLARDLENSGDRLGSGLLHR
jgi:hypothetical protein